ncbi:hypothetical protein Tco_0936960 [Tanacetum coccineum]|uniref:Uncharacterized protein n=1 Tax=Tanacetum coccineum TaxID=301880 RepID=A0ABQ5DCW1_9ASTR
MKDQPLSADASPTALSPGYIADSNPEEDKEDPEEDPADHPEEHLASADPSAVPTVDLSHSSENTEAFETDKSDCPEQKNHENQTRGARARGAVHALREGETDQNPNNIKDEIKA